MGLALVLVEEICIPSNSIEHTLQLFLLYRGPNFLQSDKFEIFAD